MIKAIFVDMDGTFLDNNKNYDRARFAKQYQALQAQDIKFVVASGNQYYQLAYYFPEIADDIAFVAENGTLIVNQGTKVAHHPIPTEAVTDSIALLSSRDDIDFVVCGLDSAYAPANASQAFMNTAHNHYRRLKQVDNFDGIDDPIIKFSIKVREGRDIGQVTATLEQALHGDLSFVTSGFSFIDLMTPGVHKAYGMQTLLKIWGIDANDCAAFGDSNNDAEMLAFAGHSFAMGNGNAHVKSIAKHTIASNDEHGVLDVIDQILEGQFN
ncbi:MAG: Cof-type HAD-IIB family hydrolase [Vibrio sp.]